MRVVGFDFTQIKDVFYTIGMLGESILFFAILILFLYKILKKK